MNTSIITYAITITLVNVSILLLYRRIFDTRNFRIITGVLMGLCVAWGFATSLVIIFQCHPISGMWNPAYAYSSQCINIKAFYTGSSGAHIAFDVIILSLPLYMVIGLKLPFAQKLALAGIFLLGGL